ncbi:MAG: sigma-70 family RNA polymerase sigma factor [Planctomycetota bacterium]|nr:sigma-70 family RNA polymerase sigma factor [Planctomycetota bacterium]MDP6989942.1 sigma-70 family RNA polymerase sigma factor [Planctomycetota bacterium]
MQRPTISHNDLDCLLTTACQDPRAYERELDALIRHCDERGCDLQISDPRTWRRQVDERHGGGKQTLEEQYRSEVDAIEHLDRAGEARLARRIEFARRRLEVALTREGIDPSRLEEAGRGGRAFPGPVRRRWAEVHALRQEMVERNLYLVLINVERYSHTRGSRLDLIQEGSAVLFRAVDGFDWRRGLLFRTYAVHWLHQAFRNHLYNFGHTVRLPVYLQKAMKHVRAAAERLGGRQASAVEIARETQLGESVVASALEASRATHSIDMGVGSEDEDQQSLRDVLVDGRGGDPYGPEMEEISIGEGVEMAFDLLAERERFVIERRFGIGKGREHTLAEIASEMGISLERVRQIQMRAMSKMNTPGVRRAVDPFLA